MRGPRVLPVVLAAVLVAELVALGAVLAVRAGDGDGAEATSTTTTASSSTTTTSVVTTTTRDPVLGNGSPVTFAFGGDVHFEGRIRARLAADPAAVLAPVAPIFERADVAVVNLETAITERGEPVGKEYTFRAPATALDALRLGHVDVASMANNHGVDFGWVGLVDSLVAEDASGFPIVGIGEDAAEAYAPWRTEVNGQRVAVFGGSEVIDNFLREPWRATEDRPGMASVYPEAIDRMLAEVSAARRDTDTIVVYLHYGRELETCPNQRQRSARRAVRRGGGRHRRRQPRPSPPGRGTVRRRVRGVRTRQLRLLQRVGGGRRHGRAAGHRHRSTHRRVRVGPGPHPAVACRRPRGRGVDRRRAEWDGLRPCTGLQP
ncbi:MAG: CapA family protein [Acidimicrobiia bacterium]|nr:CapA family protein [Acidimicrobiia bacterium]